MDDNAHLRPSKRLRTEPETVDFTATISNEYPSMQPILDIRGQLAELAGPESLNIYQPLLSSIPTSFHTTLLAFAATRDPLVAAIISNEYQEQVLLKLSRVVTFTHHSDQASYLLNQKYCNIPSSDQCELAFDVCDEIDKIFEKIKEEVKPTSSYATKLNAVKAMTEILESVCEADDTLGEEVKNSHNARGEWDEQVVKFLAKFQQYELEALANEKWFEDLRLLSDIGDSYGILEELKKAVEMLRRYRKDGERSTNNEVNNV